MKKSKRQTFVGLTKGNFRFMVFFALTTLVFYTSCKKKDDATPSTTSFSNQDTAYVDSIYLNNSIELKFGKLALQKANTNDLKNFASVIIANQTKIKNTLDSLNSKKNYKPKLPSDSLDSYHASLYSTFTTAASGWSWDSAYMAIYQLDEDYAMYDAAIDASAKANDANLKSVALSISAVIALQINSDTIIIQNNGF